MLIDVKMIEAKEAGGGDRGIKKPIEGVGAKELIGKKLNIKKLMELWDQGWGIAIHTDMNDESPYIITRKSDFFDIHGKVFECFHADDDSEDEKFMEVVIIE